MSGPHRVRKTESPYTIRPWPFPRKAPAPETRLLLQPPSTNTVMTNENSPAIPENSAFNPHKIFKLETLASVPLGQWEIERGYKWFSMQLIPFPVARRMNKGGAYGIAYLIQLDQGRAALDNLLKSTVYTVLGSTPAPGPGKREAILKVGWNEDEEDMGIFIRECQREAIAHKYLSSDENRCTKVPKCTRGLCPSVPRFYRSGMVGNSHDGKPYYLTLMDRAPGSTLYDFLAKGNQMTSAMYVALEKAMAWLWANGIAHADLHRGNIMYDAETGGMTIIDLGHAVTIPHKARKLIVEAMSGAIEAGVRSLAEVFVASSPHGVKNLQPFLNRIMYTRGYDSYNADLTAMMHYFNRLTPAERAKVPAARRVLWGFRGTAAPSLFAQAVATPLPSSPARDVAVGAAASLLLSGTKAKKARH